MKWDRSDDSFGEWPTKKATGNIVFPGSRDRLAQETYTQSTVLPKGHGYCRVGSKFDGFNQIIWHTFPGGLPILLGLFADSSVARSFQVESWSAE